MLIRNMESSDYDSVYRLWLNTPGMSLNTLDDSRQVIERYLSRNPTTCFVAEQEGEIVGVILSGHDGRRGFIYHLAVRLEERKQGIGTALVERSLEALYAEGIGKVALFVFKNNEIGNHFWAKCGFAEREDLVYRDKNIREFVIIETPLA